MIAECLRTPCLRTSENPQNANFALHDFCELLRRDGVLRSLHSAPVLVARIPATHTYDSRGGYSPLLTIIYGVLVIGGICLISLGGLEVVERLVPAETRQQHNDVAGFIYAALGVIYAVLALVVIAVFEGFQAANETVEQEANALAEIAWLAHRLPEPEGTHLQELCRSYAEEVVHKEWPLMEQGEAPLMTQTQGTPAGGPLLMISAQAYRISSHTLRPRSSSTQKG